MIIKEFIFNIIGSTVGNSNVSPCRKGISLPNKIYLLASNQCICQELFLSFKNIPT